MKVTSDIISQEFIGTTCKVARSTHSGYLGVNGPVVDETKNTFSIQHHGKMKRVAKDSAVFNFKFSDGTIVEIDGNLLVGRPEDRLKKSMKRLW